MAVGESRWAFFVRDAHYGSTEEGAPDEPAVPVFVAGVFDGSVFTPGADSAAFVGFAWQEREPFALRVWIPKRFAALDRDGELPVRERLRLLLDRHRAAGIHVYTSYADDRWSLGSGILRDPESENPLGTVVVGTRLWPDDTAQPPPS